MKEDVRTIQIELNEGDTISKTKLSDKAFQALKERNKNYVQPETFLKQFIGDQNFKKADEKLREMLEDSLPEGIKENCKYCSGESKADLDKKCQKYEIQALITFKLMAYEFVEIVRNNSHLFNDKRKRFQLTQEFFYSIRFYKNQGIMAFDMGRMMEKVLEMGLLSVNQMLAKTNHLGKSLRIINHSIDSLNTDILSYKIKGEEVPEFYQIQHDFFKNKQEFYKEEQRLNREEKLLKSKAHNQNGSKERPYSTDIAYFCYYTSESKELITENYFPSKKAWKEIGDVFSKDDTNIQKAYNRIYGNKEERLKHSKITNIDYVMENMLDDYPKAKKLALKELKMAKVD